MLAGRVTLSQALVDYLQKEKEEVSDIPDSQQEGLEGIAAAIYDETLRGKPCVLCHGLEAEDEMLVCDRCNQPWHKTCAETKPGSMLHNGPWYCVYCKGHIAMHGVTDVTEDMPLLDHLFAGTIPVSLEE